MSIEKDIVIQDACIIFDLIDLGLIGHFFDLNLTVFTCPEVIGEITDPDQLESTNVFINNGRLGVDGNGDFDKIEEIFRTNAGLSLTDCSVLELALRRSGSVLSSDLSLRKATKKSGLNVRGILWIISELVNQDIIDHLEAIGSLNRYLQINSRAPKSEIHEMIRRLTLP